MSTVYVIGAGASYGDTLRLPRPTSRLQNPPMATGFFDRRLLTALGYGQAERDFKLLIDHIRRGTTTFLSDDFGGRGWETLNIEELFTSLEIEREFNDPESNEGARLLLIRNMLLRYIRQIIAFCTLSTYGENYRRLKAGLGVNDSVITFNWDLLLDQEFIDRYDSSQLPDNQYGNFFCSAPFEMVPASVVPSVLCGSGLFLKLHGSLNWFRCGNRLCHASARVVYQRNIQACLPMVDGTTSEIDVPCGHCGTTMIPIMVPPVLRKRITDDPVIRSAWGLARTRLMAASKVVIVGFSAAPTDFYASWLLRSTVGTRAVELIVMNPNTSAKGPEHCAFSTRMRSIFRQYDEDGLCRKLCCFSEIDSVLPTQR